MNKLQLLSAFIESIEITAENKHILTDIHMALESITGWSQSRDINDNPRTISKAIWYGFTEKDDDIPEPARKRHGTIVPPDFASGAPSTAGVQSMDSYSGGLSGI